MPRRNPRTAPAPSALALELKQIHQADCLLRTHNGTCDCPHGAVIDRAVTATANYFLTYTRDNMTKLYDAILSDATRQTS